MRAPLSFVLLSSLRNRPFDFEIGPSHLQCLNNQRDLVKSIDSAGFPRKRSAGGAQLIIVHKSAKIIGFSGESMVNKGKRAVRKLRGAGHDCC